MQCLHDGAKKLGIDAVAVSRYQPDTDTVLMLYGMGGADRMPHAMNHMASGGRLVVWDAGYWQRKLLNGEKKFRVSIDGLHPQKFVMKGPSPGPGRYKATAPDQFPPRRDKGLILLAGSGPKSIAIGAQGWTAAKSKEIKQKFPGKKIAYRPKPKRPAEPSVRYDYLSMGGIEKAVSESSLVVCRHSNVAVDACMQGVPVVCDDGAAAAIYPSKLEDYKSQPDAATRQDFLNRLAYWQWSPNECRDGVVWPWLIEVLSAN